jgi:hypothetical protein
LSRDLHPHKPSRRASKIVLLADGVETEQRTIQDHTGNSGYADQS